MMYYSTAVLEIVFLFLLVSVHSTTWPGLNKVVTADKTSQLRPGLSGLFLEKVSSIESQNIIWGVVNDPSLIYKLLWNGTYWMPATSDKWNTGKQIVYPNGITYPDAEDITKAEEGSNDFYICSERDNAKKISQPSILRFVEDPNSNQLTASNFWDLTKDVPVVDYNSGFEGITWIPDSWLVAHSYWNEKTNSLYKPSLYENHGTGLFFVGLEGNGMVYSYALNHITNGYNRIASFHHNDTTITSLYFDRETGLLWAGCDNHCDGRMGVYTVGAAGQFQQKYRFERPSSMANLNTEGFAAAPQSQCVGGMKKVYWADDADTDGHGLRLDAVSCTL